MKHFKTSVVIGLFLAVYHVGTLGYEVKTHATMSEQAALKSVLVKDTALIRSYGLTGLEKFNNSEGNEKSIIELIADGSRFEDGKFRLSLKPLFHFFDPLNDEGLLFFTSPTWALEDKGKIHLLQKHSYSDARDFLYKALTATNEEDRKINFGKTSESLGHVVHHIQDMAQPQHVRLDAHLKLDLTDEELPFENRSRYEIHTEDKATGRLPGGLPYDGYAPINSKDDTKFLTTPRSFWHTKQKNPLEGEGIAEFTNTNFLSAGTNFNTNRYPDPKRLLGPSDPIPFQALLLEEGINCNPVTPPPGGGGGDCGIECAPPPPEETPPLPTNLPPACNLQGSVTFIATLVEERYAGGSVQDERSGT